MAVEARHLNFFSPQLLGTTTRKIMNPIEANIGFYNSQMQYTTAPFTAATVMDSFLPLYGSESIAPYKAAAIKSESNLTYNNIPVSKKRPRDQSNPLLCFPPQQFAKASAAPLSFLGHDISLQIQQQQLETDRLVSNHMEKVRIEIEEKREKREKLCRTVSGSHFFATSEWDPLFDGFFNGARRC